MTYFDYLSDYIHTPEFQGIISELKLDYEDKIIYPPKDKIFNALIQTPYEQVKVVILGQDPYINEHEATGLAFGVDSKCKKIPPSLCNIIKEVKSEYPGSTTDYTLESWVHQGILLLNTSLTVESKKSGSHFNYWSRFTSEMIKILNTKKYLVWILLGNKAQSYMIKINPDHGVICAGHPSPLNRSNAFNGSKVFSKCNSLLSINNLSEIIW